MYQQVGSCYYKVKNIMLKHKIIVPAEIQMLDVDYNEEYLAIMTKGNNQAIEFHELSSVLGSQQTVDLKIPHFTLKFQTEIYDYFFNKNSNLEQLLFKNFLIVQTVDALVIYRRSDRGIMKKIFSLDYTTFSSKEVKFKFLFVNPNRTEKTIFELIGCFYILQKNTLSLYYVRNLESKQQTIISDTCKVVLSHYENSELMCIKSDDPNNTEVCTYAPNFIVAKYIVSASEGKRSTKLDCFKLLTRSIDSNNFVYNHKNKYIYGNLKDKAMLFAALKNKYESKFFYKVVLYEKEHFLQCYWALINKSLFVKINVETKQVKLFKILNNQIDIDIVQKQHFEILDECGPVKAIRFLLVSDSTFTAIIENEEYLLIVEFSLDIESICSINLRFTIAKSFLSSSKILQYEIVQTNKKDSVYKFVIADASNVIKTFVIRTATEEVVLVAEFTFKSAILEFYKNKRYPHGIVVLTSNNQLTFFDIDLNYLSDFDLLRIGLDLHANSNNFQLRHLYDSFFVVN